MDGRVLLLSEDFYRGDGLGQGWKWNPPFSGLGDPTSSRDAAALPVERAIGSGSGEAKRKRPPLRAVPHMDGAAREPFPRGTCGSHAPAVMLLPVRCN